MICERAVSDWRSRLRLFALVGPARVAPAPMRLLPFTTRKVFDTSVMILIVGRARHAVDPAGLFVVADMYFIHFMGPMDPTEGSATGAPILIVVGATDDDAPSRPLLAWAAEFNVPANRLMAVRR
jgi:hypothetical protein